MPTPSRKFDRERLDATLQALAENDYNVSATARSLGVSRRLIQHLITAADQLGMTKEGSMPTLVSSPPGKTRTFADIRAARIQEFSRSLAHGASTAVHQIAMPDDGPFGVIAYGDPHWDDDGTDLSLYERWAEPVEQAATTRCYGFLLGDLTNNWLKFLGHLYGDQEVTRDEGWVLVEGYLNRIAPGLIGSCSGNHDDWSSADLLGHIMTGLGVTHRRIGLSLALKTPGGHEVTIYARHIWAGNSQWNAAHALGKAAQMGRSEDILLGGHKHTSGEMFVKNPKTGDITVCHQVASFKITDEYADTLGLQDKHVTPAIGLLIDPTRKKNDKQRITTVYDPEELVAQVRDLRQRRGFPV